MVLSAPAPDAEPGAAVAPWVARIVKLLRLMKRGIIVLVDRADDAQLGGLVRALCMDHPELLVLTEAPRIEDAPVGSVVLLATRVEDAVWLNLARPIFSERALRVILWSKAAVTGELARRAPDFFDWVARHIECPGGPPPFAVAGLRAALRARAWAVGWRGKGLEEAFAAALPGRSLLKASGTGPEEALVATVRGAGRAWIAWSNVADEQDVRRLRRALERAGRRGRCILENPRVDGEGVWPVHDTTADLAGAARTLEASGAASGGRLAALLDLEPEAVALAARLLAEGADAAEMEVALRGAVDPGAAVVKLARERGASEEPRDAALFARCSPHAAREPLADFGELGGRYREKVAQVHSRLKTIGIPPEARPHESRVELPLKELFIPLRLVPEGSGGGPVELARALSDSRSAVILADPGMGKSTLLDYLALVFARAASVEGFACPPGMLPLHISLRDFVRRRGLRPGLSFLQYLEIDARERYHLAEARRGFFEAALRRGEAAVLLDGLDEVGNETARHALATSIRTFQAEYPACRFWVTSRVFGYTDNVRLPKAFAHYRIGPLDDAQIDGFVRRWYEHQISANLQEAAEQAESLGAAVRRTPSVRRLAANPLLLTLMAFIHHGLRRLPKDRGELYEKCVEMLLKTWGEAKRGDGEAPRGLAGLQVATQKDYLAHLAFFVQQKNQGGQKDESRGLVSRQEAVDALADRHFARTRRERPAMTELEARDEMRAFVEYICDETGLLVDRGDEQLSFIHLSFQEYLAAWVFLCGTDLPRGPRFFVDHLGDPAWEEVLLLRMYVVLHGGGGESELDAILSSVRRALEKKNLPEGWLTLVRALRDDLGFTDDDSRAIFRRALGYWLEAPAFEGKWFEALEEVKLFAERARGVLYEVLGEARRNAQKAAAAVALLHLETKLFGFPADGAEMLLRRADLPEMLADLVVFAGEAGMAGLLAERAKVADWSRALRALDGPEVYRMTVRWMAEPPVATAADAATALIWEKIAADLRSRAEFAAPRRSNVHAVLFERAGAVTYETPLSQAGLPYAAVRALPVMWPRGEMPLGARLLCSPLSTDRIKNSADAYAWSELTAWIATVIASQLGHFRDSIVSSVVSNLAVQFVRGFLQDFSRNFVRAFASDVVHHYGGAFFGEFVGAFGRDFLGDFGDEFYTDLGANTLRELGSEFGRTFGRTFGGTFVGDFRTSFLHRIITDFSSFLRDLGIDSNTPDWKVARDRAMEDERNQLRALEDESFWLDCLTSWGFARLDSGARLTSLDLTLAHPLAMPLLLADVWCAAATHMVLGAARYAAAAYPDDDMPDDALEAWLLHNPIEVYATAFAWEERCRAIDRISGPAGALFIAHAAYASLMTGLECKLPVAPDLADPRVRVSHVLYELCNFRDAEGNVRALEAEIASAGPELRPLLEASGLISASVDKPAVMSIPTPEARRPQPEPDKPAIFTWLHLSDIHFGHVSAAKHWDQALVLDALHRDIDEHKTRGVPTPSAILITGDIAYAGAAPQYERARSWLDTLAKRLGIPADRIFLTPGNHDVDRRVDKTNRNAARLIRLLRDGDDPLDDILANVEDKALLTSRLAPYLSFASAFPSIQSPDPLFWSHRLVENGLPIRLIGLATPLLSAAGDVDMGKLRLGNTPLAATLTNLPDGELILVLTHHPFRGGWLADQRDADRWVQSRAHVHLSGHVHEHDSEDARGGAGTGILRIAAGAAYGDLPGVPASHGYSIAAVVPHDGGSLRVRIWPRRWADKTKSFRADTENTPEGRPYAEHPLPRLAFPLPVRT